MMRTTGAPLVVVDQEKPSRREVVPVVNKVVQHGVLLDPTALKYERPLQILTRAGLEEKMSVSPEKPDTYDPELGEFPDQCVMVGLEGWRSKPQHLLQLNDSMEPKQRLHTGACAPPPKEIVPHIKTLSPSPEEILMTAKGSPTPSTIRHSSPRLLTMRLPRCL